MKKYMFGASHALVALTLSYGSSLHFPNQGHAVLSSGRQQRLGFCRTGCRPNIAGRDCYIGFQGGAKSRIKRTQA